MKHLLFPLAFALLLLSCNQESDDVAPANSRIESRSANKVDVCHNGHVISVSVNSLPAHLAHGDQADMDGDGYFAGESACGPEDCDDTDPDLTDNCCLQGTYCSPHFGGMIVYFQEDCNADVDYIYHPCNQQRTWTFLGVDNNVYTYLEFDPCGIDQCIVTVVDDGTNLTASYDCVTAVGVMTPCEE